MGEAQSLHLSLPLRHIHHDVGHAHIRTNAEFAIALSPIRAVRNLAPLYITIELGLGVHEVVNAQVVLAETQGFQTITVFESDS